MVDTIEDLLIHKEELYRKKEENLILKRAIGEGAEFKDVRRWGIAINR